MRVIHKAEQGPFKALVRGRNMHGEYEVDFYVDGVVHAPARYFTDDRADAEGTADAWVSSKVASDQFWAGQWAQVWALSLSGRGTRGQAWAPGADRGGRRGLSSPAFQAEIGSEIRPDFKLRPDFDVQVVSDVTDLSKHNVEISNDF